MTTSEPSKFRYQYHSSHILWFCLFLLSFFLQAFDWVDSWRFKRDLAEQGDVWLLLSGHIVHLNWSHWLLNMAGLAIVAFFFSAHAGIKQWVMVILVSVCVINMLSDQHVLNCKNVNFGPSSSVSLIAQGRVLTVIYRHQTLPRQFCIMTSPWPQFHRQGGFTLSGQTCEGRNIFKIK